MKGAIDIEFILSVVVFLTTIVFVTFIIVSNIPLFRMEAASEDLRSRAYEVSELLIFDRGFPQNWGDGGVVAERLGLSTGKRYELSPAKIAKLESMCIGDYTNVKTLLGHDFRNDISIEVTDSENTKLINCTPPAITTVRPKFQITRFAVLPDKKIIRMVVGVD